MMVLCNIVNQQYNMEIQIFNLLINLNNQHFTHNIMIAFSSLCSTYMLVYCQNKVNYAHQLSSTIILILLIQNIVLIA